MGRYLANIDPGRRDTIRAIGGLLLGAGALVLFLRKGNQDSWGDFPLLLVLLVPCVLLYGLGLGLLPSRVARPAAPAGELPEAAARPWQAVLVVFGVFLIPLALFQFLELVGGDTGDSLNTAWIFAVTTALAAFAAWRGGIWVCALLAAFGAMITWLALWDKVLGDPSGTTVRWLLIVVAGALLAASLASRPTSPRQSVDLLTGAGLAAVLAGFLGVAGVAVDLLAGPFAGRAIGAAAAVNGAAQHQEWDVFLLVVSVALIWAGSRSAFRGPAYVGGFGLLAFILSAGSQISSLGSGDGANGAFVGWPMLLLLLGAAALIVGFFLPLGQDGPGDDRAGGDPVEAPPGPAGGAGGAAAAPTEERPPGP